MPENNYVKVPIFRMAIIILASAISGLFGLYIAQNNQISDISGDIKAIGVDIEWIKNIANEGSKSSLRSFDGNEATLNLAVGREKMKEKLDLVLKNGQIKLK